jgi:hypothetical protein
MISKWAEPHTHLRQLHNDKKTNFLCCPTTVKATLGYIVKTLYYLNVQKATTGRFALMDHL